MSIELSGWVSLWSGSLASNDVDCSVNVDDAAPLWAGSSCHTGNLVPSIISGWEKVVKGTVL